ncbi:MAG TPA: hypothetical protein VIJ31_13030 [Acidothermaceae bacterium]
MAAMPLRVLCGVTLLLLVGCRASGRQPAASEPTTLASVGGSTSSASVSAPAGSVSSRPSTPISASSPTASTPAIAPATPSQTRPADTSTPASPGTGHATASPGGKPATPSPGGNPLVDEIWGNNAVPFRPSTSADYLHTPRVQQSFGGQAASLVPANWKYVDETIPSDHNDLMWYDPANPAARIEFTGTGCESCVLQNVDATHPVRDVVRGLPFDTTSYDVYNHGLDAGFRETDADGYAVNGVVALIGTDADPNGYVTYRVSLPADDTPLATRILNSFTGLSQGTR